MLARTIHATMRFPHQSSNRRRIYDGATSDIPICNAHITELRRYAVECALDVDSEHGFVVGRVKVSYRTQMTRYACQICGACDLSFFLFLQVVKL